MKKRIVFLLLALTLALGFSACGNRESGQHYDDVFASLESFPAFAGKDFDGNAVDESIFADHNITLVNFWFNECSPCVDELPILQKLNESLQEKGGAVIGINVGALNGDADVIATAKEIMKTQGASYQNVYFDADSEAGKLASSVLSFPTTILVDRDGKIIGKPVVGGLNGEEAMAELQKQIDDALTR